MSGSPAPEGLRIAPCGPERLAELSDLWVASWAAAMPEIDFAARRPWFLSHFATLREGGAHTLAADAPEGLAGFVIINPATGYLDQLAVAPASWGGGVAEALMAAARAASPGGIELHVNQDNARAIGFYRRCGFAIAEAGENPLSGRAIWRMVWTPPPA